MLSINISSELATSFIGALFALLSAGIVWVLKSAYERHRAEVIALSRFERIFANNLTILRDNFKFLNDWINSLEKGRPFSIHFESYYINEEETYKIKNLELINHLLSLNYMLRRTSFDFDNIYKTYWEAVTSIEASNNIENNKESFTTLNKNVLFTLRELNNGYKAIEEKLVETIAYIRAVNIVRRHSFFGYINLLSIDIFPKVTDDSVKKQVEILRKNISRLD